jgi:magnesium transporter
MIRKEDFTAPVIKTIGQVRKFIRHFDLNLFTTQAREFHASDVAAVLEGLDENQMLMAFRRLEPPKRVKVFEYLEWSNQQKLLQGLDEKENVFILNAMSPDDRTLLLSNLPEIQVAKLLNLLTPEERKEAADLLGYTIKSVGRLMNPRFIGLSPEMSIAEAQEYILKKGIDSESINVVYVANKQNVLVDDIPLRRLLLHDRQKKISEIMDYHFTSLNINDDVDTAVNMFKQYDRVSLPVINDQGHMLGVVTVDDVLDVAERKDTAEIQKFGGVEELDYPYVKTPFFSLLRKRAGWLVVLFIGEMLTATAMGYFDKEISKAVVLALFVPLIISSGGNSGSQAATLIIRAMALRELTFKDWWYVMRREILSGLSLGFILGTIGFIRITVWQYFLWYDYGVHWLLLAVTIFFSLIGVVMWGTLSGSMIPMLLKRCRIDPATSSAPFVATLVDVTGLVIYFSIAAIILKGTLL